MTSPLPSKDEPEENTPKITKDPYGSDVTLSSRDEKQSTSRQSDVIAKDNKAQELDNILEEFRKTCFLVNDSLDNPKAVSLMAMAVINTKSQIQALIAQSNIELLEEIAAVYHSEPSQNKAREKLSLKLFSELSKLKEEV